MTPASGPLRTTYLNLARGLRRALEGTTLLERWTQRAIERPGTVAAHLRTLLAVHNANDLVRLDLPWWTYEAIAKVDAFIREREGRVRVFEYGSGASTIWLARRCDSLTTVEHDPEWAALVEEMVKDADKLRCLPRLLVPEVPTSDAPRIGSRAPSGRRLDFHDYVRSIEQSGEFDLILIDGRAREACLTAALAHSAGNALILFDDAQRRRYREALRGVTSEGWQVEMTRGATPCQPLPRQTALITPIL